MPEGLKDPLAELARLEGVPSAVAAARDAVDAVLRDRGRRVVRPEQTAAALLSAARATARLEDEADAEADAEADPGADSGADPDRWGPGAIRMHAEFVTLAPLVRVAPGQAMARAHALLGRGLLPDDRLGRVRPQHGRADRLAALDRTLAAATTAPAIVVAAIAHGEVATVAPFEAGNGIVARAMEHLILIDGDVDPSAVTVPEAAHLAARDRYRQALADYRTGTVAGMRSWLLYTAAAVARGAELSPMSTSA